MVESFLLNFQAHLIGNLGIYQGHFPGNFLEILITYWTPRANCFCIVSDFGGKIKLALAPINKFRALFSGVKLETRVFTFFFTAAKVFESLLHNFELLRQTSSRPRTKLFKGNHINSSDQNIKQHLKAKSTEKLVNLD